jgi:glucosamine--fructose-6-phosphate aminotransferase (isomerizing)
MCGIVGYTGQRDALPVLMDGLRRLEYRGYDSAGVAVLDDGGAITVRKTEGKLAALATLVEARPPAGRLGIGHTRWATHGAPITRNAHPHPDARGRVVVVHNGIIENHDALHAELAAAGVTFTSDTDTEVVAQLIGRELDQRLGGNGHVDAAGALEAAVRAALARVEGSFAMVVISPVAPDVLVAARSFSPLVVGLGQGEQFLASDIPALLQWTREFLILEDGEMAVLRPDSVSVTKLDGTVVERDSLHVDWDAAAAEKGGYPTFVRKEIDEQPAALAETMRGRMDGDRAHLVELDGLSMDGIRRAYIVAAGTSLYAGLYAKRLLERWARLPVEVATASEFRYGDPVVASDSLVIAITQSGETADTLAALRRARDAGAPTLALTNVVGSSVTRVADATLQLQVGPEIGVVATKTFTGQLVLLALLAADVAVRRGNRAPDDPELAEAMAGLRALPGQMATLLTPAAEEHVANVARSLAHVRSMFYVGRGFGHIVALEGALKLKEISYIHAEGYPAGELKHGPIAMLDASMPVLAVATHSPTYAKVLANIEEIRAREAPVIVIANEGDERVTALAEHVLSVPRTLEPLAPILDVVPTQLFAYHVALERGCDVDQPRNLAKSVTVE